MREELKSKTSDDHIENGENTENPGGTSLADDIITAEAAPADKVTGKTVLGWLRKWWMIPVYLIVMIILIIFISHGDEKDLYKAHFKGENEVTVGDVDYKLLSKDEKGHYIASYVSDKLTGVKNKKVATMRSYILYVSVFYSVTGDENMDYLMDGKNSVYVKSSLYDSVKQYYDDVSNITSYKITDKSKDMNSMTALSNEDYEALLAVKGEEIKFTDALITENYATRREIYGYYDNGLFCRAVAELFRDKENNIYLTTKMVDGKENKDGITLLYGIELPEDMQEKYRSIWN